MQRLARIMLQATISLTMTLAPLTEPTDCPPTLANSSRNAFVGPADGPVAVQRQVLPTAAQRTPRFCSNRLKIIFSTGAATALSASIPPRRLAAHQKIILSIAEPNRMWIVLLGHAPDDAHFKSALIDCRVFLILQDLKCYVDCLQGGRHRPADAESPPRFLARAPRAKPGSCAHGGRWCLSN